MTSNNQMRPPPCKLLPQHGPERGWTPCGPHPRGNIFYCSQYTTVSAITQGHPGFMSGGSGAAGRAREPPAKINESRGQAAPYRDEQP